MAMKVTEQMTCIWFKATIWTNQRFVMRFLHERRTTRRTLVTSHKDLFPTQTFTLWKELHRSHEYDAQCHVQRTAKAEHLTFRFYTAISNVVWVKQKACFCAILNGPLSWDPLSNRFTACLQKYLKRFTATCLKSSDRFLPFSLTDLGNIFSNCSSWGWEKPKATNVRVVVWRRAVTLAEWLNVFLCLRLCIDDNINHRTFHSNALFGNPLWSRIKNFLRRGQGREGESGFLSSQI